MKVFPPKKILGMNFDVIIVVFKTVMHIIERQILTGNMEGKMMQIRRVREFVLSERPPFPQNMLIEISNVCNNDCVFCGHHRMKRRQGYCDKDVMTGIIQQAYDAGTREIGFYMQGEPLLNPDLELYVSFCKSLGFEYIYITTNGVNATVERIEKLCRAGLSSIKFSINAATRETYKKIHRRDYFDVVMKNLVNLAARKQTGGIKIPIFASYVVVKDNEDEIEMFKNRMGMYCDDIDIVYARNQAGNMPELESKNEIPCIQLFNRLHVTKEGYLNACCSDTDNMLAIADLREVSLRDAWYSEDMIELRRQHIQKDIRNNICYNCIYGRYDRVVFPINEKLQENSMNHN